MPDVREKLVELLGNLFCGDYGINGCDSCKYNTEVMCSAHACADRLIANGVTIQRWIPVEERLPEMGQEVICFSGGVLKPGVYCYLFWSKDYDNWARVTHWMPLPEPPKEE